MSDHEQLESSVAAWVLGALDADEAESIRVHVEGCASCREVANRLRRVVGALPLAVDEVTPPQRLRERVLAAAAASPRPGGVPTQVRVVPPRRAPRPPLPRIPAYAVAAIAVLTLLTGLVAGDVLRGTQAPPQSQVTRFTLAGHQQMSSAQATVIDLRSDGLALVDFRGLPQLASDRVYEVWLIPSGGSPQAAGVFVPDSNGEKVVLVNRSLQGYAVMAVTEEPGPDGSPAPSQQPQLYGNIA